jgi:hypothetical protein
MYEPTNCEMMSIACAEPWLKEAIQSNIGLIDARTEGERPIYFYQPVGS